MVMITATVTRESNRLRTTVEGGSAAWIALDNSITPGHVDGSDDDDRVEAAFVPDPRSVRALDELIRELCRKRARSHRGAVEDAANPDARVGSIVIVALPAGPDGVGSSRLQQTCGMTAANRLS